MGVKRNRQTTFPYPEEIDLCQANKFILEWQNLAIHIAFDLLCTRKIYAGRDTAESAALEGCYKAFTIVKRMSITCESHIKGIVRMNVKRTFWTMCIMNGYVPSRGQIFFPNEWVKWEDYFDERSAENDTPTEVDHRLMRDWISQFPDGKSEVVQLFLAGYNFYEIGVVLNQVKSSTLKMFKRITDRLQSIANHPTFVCQTCKNEFPNNGSFVQSHRFCRKRCRKKCQS